MKSKVIIWWACVGGDRNPLTAEQTLNNWLAENQVDIKHITQSEAGNVLANRRITYTVWYEEKG